VVARSARLPRAAAIRAGGCCSRTHGPARLVARLEEGRAPAGLSRGHRRRGGHGLATAYYLAAEFGITDVAVLERGPIGLGNVGRNTTIVRSNYFQPDNVRFYDYSLKLWEGLEKTLNFIRW